ncbi:Bardet-Biedl syndrome 1 [Tribonema minus]|uniref:Bardet-Biedl syndrome 1 n=1 Tax=Tribonema minus TaxID=303371 RepID=A0A836CLJ0_9STRA|nr:Bardet-Biedl syndrome 1 [Tribonema minus]
MNAAAATPAASAPLPAANKKSGPWLHAWYDPLAGIHVHGGAMALADLQGDGDGCLLVADDDERFKIYRGTSFAAVQPLLEQPSALCAYHPDAGAAAARTPSVAIAAGPSVYIYRNLRPYYKFTTPAQEPCQQELAAWAGLTRDSPDAALAAAADALRAARRGGAALSARSADLLASDAPAARRAAADAWHGRAMAQPPAVTCLTKLRRAREGADAPCCLVVGTEAGGVLLVGPPGGVIVAVTLPAPPALIEATGLLDVEWRVVAACRNGKIYTVKNGEGRRSAVLAGAAIELNALPVALARQGRLIHVATMDRVLHCYSLKGRRAHALRQPAPIVALEPLARGAAECLLVALASGALRLYAGAALLHTLELGAPPAALRFGRFGREDAALAVVLRGSGALVVKILDRKAALSAPSAADAGPPAEQDVPLPVPRKTRLFVEQAAREREAPAAMHRAFQRDLARLRLRTARAYVEAVAGGDADADTDAGGSSGGGGGSVRLHAECLGLGPRFRLRVQLVNCAARPVAGARVCVASVPPALYAVPRALVEAPALLPQVPAHVEVGLVCTDPAGAAGAVRVLVLGGGGEVLASAVVNMPVSEPPLQ